ncbi:hypothetical protein BH11MYX4_BH11MYX4_58460 [soil metagenome]
MVTVRALAEGCEDRYRVAPAQGPCWFAQTFTVRPTAGLPAEASEHDGSSVAGTCSARAQRASAVRLTGSGGAIDTPRNVPALVIA